MRLCQCNISKQYDDGMMAGDYWSDPHHCFGYISSATFNAEGSSIAFKYHAALCSPAPFHPNHT